MASLIQRPTPRGGSRHEHPWIVRGTWGERSYGLVSRIDFYTQLRTELITAGVLPSATPLPSNKYHDHVTLAVMQSSWVEGKWVPDESLADRLRRLRAETTLSQEKFAERYGFSVGTIKAIESGARGSNATWATLSAIAEALKKPITVFCGVEGFDPEKRTV